MNLQEKYNKEIVKEFVSADRCNVFEVPKIEKIVLNIGLGEALKNSKLLDQAVENLAKICGQAPVKTIAKKSIATFKLREGYPIGAKVTVRGKRAYDFVDKLITIVLPRVRDFRGISADAFDKSGNYNLGITEIAVFPEINPEELIANHGVQITVVIKAKSKEDSLELLKKIGFPFKKDN